MSLANDVVCGSAVGDGEVDVVGAALVLVAVVEGHGPARR